MSSAGWYHDKSAECGQLAEQATDSVLKAQHVRDQKHWHSIALSIETQEAKEARDKLSR
jgi:hypothetical protein